MQRYYILLKASGGYELPVWLPYRLDADRDDKALEKEKNLEKAYYPVYKIFETQLIEMEGRIEK